MKRFRMLFFIVPILAFCSIVYELLLAQSLAAFLENTILRYSVTIGLYMVSMGFGAMAAEGRWVKFPILSLLIIEIFLTIFGGFAIILLHLLNLLVSKFVFTLLAHGLIILIGILTGFEIPLLIKISNKERKNSENIILGLDYIGALLGTLIFAFIFYPKMGLIGSSLFVGALNALTGILLWFMPKRVSLQKKRVYNFALCTQMIFFIGIVVCLLSSNILNEYFMSKYLGG